MIYAFCADEAFMGLNNKPMQSRDEVEANAFGSFDDAMINYCLIPTILADPRSVKPDVGSSSRLPVFQKQAYGRMILNFDNTRAESIPLGSIIRTTVMGKGDAAAIDRIAADTNLKTALFNIIECCFLQRTTISIPTREDIELRLLEGKQYTFKGYVPDSLQLSSTAIESNIRLTGGSQLPNPVFFQSSIQFKFSLDKDTTIEFKIWMGCKDFKENYPICTIMQCVFPCEPLKLLDMDFANKTIAVIESSNYKDEKLSAAIAKEDHTGLAIYTSRYINSTLASSTYRMPFTLLYKGAAPSASMMREYIRDRLMEIRVEDSGLWKLVLPDLFVDGGYLLVPFYNKRTLIIEEAITIERNIIQYDNIEKKLMELYPNIDIDKLLHVGCFLMGAGSELYIFAFPLDSNSDDHRDLYKEHPLYQHIDADGSGDTSHWDTMPEKTQRFNIDLSICIKIALDLTPNNNRYTLATYEGKKYYSFVSNFIEYQLLTKESFGV